jgi:hypothetical protein
MLADVFTKPLQGGAFVKFRNAVLNTKENDLTVATPSSQLTGCVMDHRKALPVERLYGVREEDDDAEKDVAATDG